MKSILLSAAMLAALARGSSINVPPYAGDGQLSGAALSPKYHEPRNVNIYNPKRLGIGRRVNVNKRYVPPASTAAATALYTMLNIPGASNYILAYPLFENGTIDTNQTNVGSYGGAANEHGQRFQSTHAVTLAYQDALHSQGSLVQSGANLFAVNAGSGTFSQYSINCSDPTQLIYQGTTTTNGQYPNTLAVAPLNQITCVGTTGSDAGIECYTWGEGNGAPQQFGNALALELPVQQAPGIPVGLPDTLSQLLFTDDENFLIAVVKGATDAAGIVTAPGYINVYLVNENGPQPPVKSELKGTEFLFGCTFQYGTYNLFCADAGVGTVSLVLNGTSYAVTVQSITPAAEINLGSVNAWTAQSPYTNGPFYASAINRNEISAFDKSTGKFIKTTQVPYDNAQLSEMATANNYVYGLTYGEADITGKMVKPPRITVARDLELAGAFEFIQNIEVFPFSTSGSGIALFNPQDENNICGYS